jgi:hypothetical protein
MVGKQNNCCAICGCGMTMIASQPNSCDIDHDHSKKKGELGFIRGLLCHNCNQGIGKMRESLVALRRAVEYLTKWQS